MNLPTMVRLKNGTEELSTLVAVVVNSLKNLIEDDPISFYELVSLVRDRNHKVFSQHQIDVLKRFGFMDVGGNVHQTISNVVLSAVTGEDLSMTLGDPVAR